MKVVGQTMPHTYISVNTIQVAICTVRVCSGYLLFIHFVNDRCRRNRKVSLHPSLMTVIYYGHQCMCVYDFMLGDAIAAFISSFMMYTEQKCKLLQPMIKKRSAHLAQNQNTTHLGQPFTLYNQEYSNVILCIFCTYYLYTMY